VRGIARLLCLAALAAIPQIAAAREPVSKPVPIPKPRPATFEERAGRSSPPAWPVPSSTLALAPAPELQALPAPETIVGPTACEMRLEEIASFKPLPMLMGPGACGASDVVRLESVLMPDRTRVALHPPATLRCPMAETLARWVREDVGPAAREFGSPLAALSAYDSYECRGRNRVAGAKISEHGKANAIDVKGIRLGSGRTVEWTDVAVTKDYRDRMRTAACARFNTVLGPGSDGYHEHHIHLDLAERSRGYKMCQWDVREPGPVAAIPPAEVPLPLPRPTAFTGAERKPL
jgi:hypothetical protein